MEQKCRDVIRGLVSEVVQDVVLRGPFGREAYILCGRHGEIKEGVQVKEN